MIESISGIGFSNAARVQRVVVERGEEGLTLSDPLIFMHEYLHGNLFLAQLFKRV